MEARDAALDRARHHASTWLASLDERAVPASADTDEIMRRLGELPNGPTPAAEVVDLLAEACEPGLAAIPSGRFFGMVIGGALPAALGADWLTSAWDQNVGLRSLTPAGAAVEEVAGRWLLDLLGLPTGSAVGFVTARPSRTSPAWPPRATPCSAGPGTTYGPGWWAGHRSGSWSGPSVTRRSTSRCGSSASATRTSYRRTSRGGSGPTRWPTPSSEGPGRRSSSCRRATSTPATS